MDLILEVCRDSRITREKKSLDASSEQGHALRKGAPAPPAPARLQVNREHGKDGRERPVRDPDRGGNSSAPRRCHNRQRATAAQLDDLGHQIAADDQLFKID